MRLIANDSKEVLQTTGGRRGRAIDITRMAGLREQLKANAGDNRKCAQLVADSRFDLMDKKRNKDAWRLAFNLVKACGRNRITEAINTLDWFLNEYEPTDGETRQESTGLLYAPETLVNHCRCFSHYEHAGKMFSDLKGLREGFRKHKGNADKCRALLDAIKPEWEPGRYRWLLTRLRKAIDQDQLEQAINTLAYLIELRQRKTGERAKSGNNQHTGGGDNLSPPRQRNKRPNKKRNELLARLDRRDTESPNHYVLKVLDASLIEFGVFAGDAFLCQERPPKDGDMV